MPHEDQISHLTQNVNRNFSPSELEITDLRIAEINRIPFRVPLIQLTPIKEFRDMAKFETVLPKNMLFS